MPINRIQKTNAEKEVDTLVQGWIGITEKDDPIEFRAWASYRSEKLGYSFTPKGFTVPTPFPPTTYEGEANYAFVLSKIHEAIGGAPRKKSPARWFLEPETKWPAPAKTAAQILAEHGFLPYKPDKSDKQIDVPAQPPAYRDAKITDELRNSALAKAAVSIQRGSR